RPAERGRAAAAAHRGGRRDRGPVRGTGPAAPGRGGAAPGGGVAAGRPGRPGPGGGGGGGGRRRGGRGGGGAGGRGAGPAEAVAFEEAVRLYRQALAAGGEEIGEADRNRLELALAAALLRGGDMPGAQETAVRVGRRAERRRDRLGLARAALVMEASGVPE